MNTKDFYYDLPESLIAQTPLEDRTGSRLMVLDKGNGKIEHRNFKDLIDYLNEGDLLVLNDTRVIPARIYGNRPGKEEKVEILLLKRREKDIWECLVRPGKKARPGHILEFSEDLKGEVKEIIEDGLRLIEFKYKGIFEEILDSLGEMPLPPYIRSSLEDRERYQTVYSKYKGSAAAPTAGLHFTEDYLNKIRLKGVEIAYVTLHVGLGTFRPVKVTDVLDHKMHKEFISISQETAEKVNACKSDSRRVIAVGTTTTRALEASWTENGLEATSKETDIFIYPGYNYKVVDGLITNFHLPESTLLMLVSAFSTREIILKAYNEGVKEGYRFFSFGDSMFIK